MHKVLRKRNPLVKQQAPTNLFVASQFQESKKNGKTGCNSLSWYSRKLIHEKRYSKKGLIPLVPAKKFRLA